MLVIESSRHGRILRALAGEHEHQLPLELIGLPGHDLVGCGEASGLNRVADAAAKDCPAVRKERAPVAQRKANIGNILIGTLAQMLDRIRGRGFECRCRLGRYQQ